MHYHQGQTASKQKEYGHFEQSSSIKKSSVSLTVVGLNDNRGVYIAYKFYEPKRFVRCLKKIQGKYIQEQQPNSFHCYNQNLDISDKMEQKSSKNKIGIRMKKW